MIPELRGYQSRAIDSARAHLDAGKRAPLIVSPTGSGKTTMMAEIARCHLLTPGRRVLALCHRQELQRQISDRFGAFGVASNVTTVQGLLGMASLGGLPKVSLVLLDEAHHYVADEWSQVAKFYGDAVRVGFTATPERGDGRGLGAIFDSLVVAATIRELTELGHLCSLRIIDPGRRLDPGELAQHPADAYQEHCPGERAVVFASGVPEARELAVEFATRGISAAVIHGAMPDYHRLDALRGHELGTIPVLINVFCLTEGWDSPATSACILARGCSTLGALIQMAGRVLRPFKNKRRALLIDLSGVCQVFGNPTDDMTYSLNGRGIRAGESARFCMVCSALIPEEHEGPCPECGAEPGGNEKKPTKIVNVPLGDFIGIRTGDQEKRAATLAHWMREGFSKGHKPGWAKMMFRQSVGFWPTKSVIDMATDLLRGAA